MILQLGKDDSTFRKQYLLCLDALVDKATMLRRAKVQFGSYAGDLIADLHEDIFCYSLDLKHDYLTYYEIEYDSFFQYARRRFLFDIDVAKTIAERFDASAAIFLLEPSHYFLEDEYGTGFLEKLLRVDTV